MTLIKFLGVALVLLAIGPLWVAASGAITLSADWRTASRDSAGLAPLPRDHPAAIVQVYAARAFNWRGIFAVHTWIATKEENAKSYRVHQVLGWNQWAGRRVVESEFDMPDRAWYGAPPTILHDIRGAEAAALIPQIEAAVKRYPYPDHYRLWPGPNSNTFVAFVARQVPALRLNLPGTAIGKDFLPNGALAGSPVSGTGIQWSLGGIVGLTLAREEGLEINLGGAVFGINPWRLNLSLPGVGRLGL